MRGAPVSTGFALREVFVPHENHGTAVEVWQRPVAPVAEFAPPELVSFEGGGQCDLGAGLRR